MKSKKENFIINVTLVINLIIALLKLVTGFMFNFSSLIADSFQSFADFITDIISKIASKISKKRATKKYPFGYGMIEYIVNLVIGITLFALAIFILIRSFEVHEVHINKYLFIILMIIIALKYLVVKLLKVNGDKLKSNLLLTSAKESNADLISTIVVFIISLVLIFQEKIEFLKYIDSIGSILISLLIFKISFTIIMENIHSLLGENDNNSEIELKIREILEKNREIADYDAKLIKNGNYYVLYLEIKLINEQISVKKLINLEKNVKKDIKLHIKSIKYVSFELI